jgi:gag-polypeptide of LTR copia-type
MDATKGETSIKVVLFSGKSSDWITWEEKFLARAKRKGYKDLLLGKVEVPKESATESDSDKKKNKEIRDLNDIGYSDLILSMDTTTGSGKVAFSLVRASKSKDYPDGNITNAWSQLKGKYAPSTAPTLAKYHKQFYGAKLKHGSDPDSFITYLEDIRLKMEEMDSVITDTQFLLHRMNNLTNEYDVQVNKLESRIGDKEKPLAL